MKAAVIVVAGLLVLSVLGVVVLEWSLSSRLESGKRALVVLSAWEPKPALEEIATEFEQQTGRRVRLLFGTSGTMLAQLKRAEEGDLYICASARARTTAKEEGLIDAASGRLLAYLVPGIIVRRGNPLGIEYLNDIADREARLAIADPALEPMGCFAAELVEATRLGDDLRPLVQAMTPSAPEAVQLVSLGNADVAIAWRMMQQWEPDFLEVVEIPEDVTRIGLLTVAKTMFCRDGEAADEFLDYLQSNEARAIFAKWRYTTTREEAVKAGPDAKLGGEPELPERWRAPAQGNNSGAN